MNNNLHGQNGNQATILPSRSLRKCQTLEFGLELPVFWQASNYILSLNALKAFWQLDDVCPSAFTHYSKSGLEKKTEEKKGSLIEWDSGAVRRFFPPYICLRSQTFTSCAEAEEIWDSGAMTDEWPFWCYQLRPEITAVSLKIDSWSSSFSAFQSEQKRPIGSDDLSRSTNHPWRSLRTKGWHHCGSFACASAVDIWATASSCDMAEPIWLDGAVPWPSASCHLLGGSACGFGHELALSAWLLIAFKSSSVFCHHDDPFPNRIGSFPRVRLCVRACGLCDVYVVNF